MRLLLLAIAQFALFAGTISGTSLAQQVLPQATGRTGTTITVYNNTPRTIMAVYVPDRKRKPPERVPPGLCYTFFDTENHLGVGVSELDGGFQWFWSKEQDLYVEYNGVDLFDAKPRNPIPANPHPVPQPTPQPQPQPLGNSGTFQVEFVNRSGMQVEVEVTGAEVPGMGIGGAASMFTVDAGRSAKQAFGRGDVFVARMGNQTFRFPVKGPGQVVIEPGRIRFNYSSHQPQWGNGPSVNPPSAPEPAATPKLGFDYQMHTVSRTGETGMFVRYVVPNSRAEQMGLRAGDFITKVNGSAANSIEAYRQQLRLAAQRDGRVILTTRDTHPPYFHDELITYLDRASASPQPIPQPQVRPMPQPVDTGDPLTGVAAGTIGFPAFTNPQPAANAPSPRTFPTRRHPFENLRRNRIRN